jgi:hypothetical protein
MSALKADYSNHNRKTSIDLNITENNAIQFNSNSNGNSHVNESSLIDLDGEHNHVHIEGDPNSNKNKYIDKLINDNDLSMNLNSIRDSKESITVDIINREKKEIALLLQMEDMEVSGLIEAHITPPTIGTIHNIIDFGDMNLNQSHVNQKQFTDSANDINGDIFEGLSMSISKSAASVFPSNVMRSNPAPDLGEKTNNVDFYPSFTYVGVTKGVNNTANYGGDDTIAPSYPPAPLTASPLHSSSTPIPHRAMAGIDGFDNNGSINESHSQINNDRNIDNYNNYNNNINYDNGYGNMGSGNEVYRQQPLQPQQYDNGYSNMGSGNEIYRQQPFQPQQYNPHQPQQIHTESTTNKSSPNKASTSKGNSKFHFISAVSDVIKPSVEIQNYRDLKPDISHSSKGKEVSVDSFSFLSDVLKSPTKSSVSTKKINI